MGEPTFGEAKPMNTSRMSTNRGTTDNPNKLSAVDRQVKEAQEKTSRPSKEESEVSKNETLQRLKKMKEEREKKDQARKRGAGREDMMSRQRQDTIMRREEEKKNKAQGMGGGTVFG